MTVKIKQMKKGKGYHDHVKPSGKSYGDAFKDDAIGPLEARATLNEWSEYDRNWKFPNPIKGKKT